MLNFIFQDVVDVYRRTSQGVDSLNNPIYDLPTSGPGWSKVYSGISVKIALLKNRIQFSPMGERILPLGTVYYSTDYTINPEDRILYNGIEYVVVNTVKAYRSFDVLDHYEAEIDLV